MTFVGYGPNDNYQWRPWCGACMIIQCAIPQLAAISKTLAILALANHGIGISEERAANPTAASLLMACLAGHLSRAAQAFAEPGLPVVMTNNTSPPLSLATPKWRMTNLISEAYPSLLPSPRWAHLRPKAASIPLDNSTWPVRCTWQSWHKLPNEPKLT